jgi:hypothetical protein
LDHRGEVVRRMQDLNLRDAHHADHRFRDGCLPGLGQSSLHGDAVVIVIVVVVVEVSGVEPDPSPHQGAAQTAMLHLVCAEGARIERAPGPSVPDHGVATRCLANSASPPRSCVPPAGVEPACPCGRAGLSRVRLPFRHGGRAARRGFEPRSPDSESGVHADLDQRASITWLPLAAGVGCPRVERGVFRSRSGWVGRLPRIRGADGRRVFLQYPREDSNLDLDVRSVALCPLSYGGQMLLVPLVTVLETAPLPKLTDSGVHLRTIGRTK